MLLRCDAMVLVNTNTLTTQMMDIQKMQMSKMALELNKKFSRIQSVATRLFADRELTVLANRDVNALAKSDHDVPGARDAVAVLV